MSHRTRVFRAPLLLPPATAALGQRRPAPAHRARLGDDCRTAPPCTSPRPSSSAAKARKLNFGLRLRCLIFGEQMDGASPSCAQLLWILACAQRMVQHDWPWVGPALLPIDAAGTVCRCFLFTGNTIVLGTVFGPRPSRFMKAELPDRASLSCTVSSCIPSNNGGWCMLRSVYHCDTSLLPPRGFWQTCVPSRPKCLKVSHTAQLISADTCLLCDCPLTLSPSYSPSSVTRE